MSDIILPWPPASLSGHNTGHWRARSAIVAKHREWARLATLAAGVSAPDQGDIHLIVTFYPPDRRSDRLNFPARCKPHFDGIADALKVNDKRFVASYHYAEPVKDARVVIVLEPAHD